ncbi:Uncharacterised protein [Neisseria animalis]|nr:Uncharacterised protein [Neisseria animalis]
MIQSSETAGNAERQTCCFGRSTRSFLSKARRGRIILCPIAVNYIMRLKPFKSSYVLLKKQTAAFVGAAVCFGGTYKVLFNAAAHQSITVCGITPHKTSNRALTLRANLTA